jgi:circadian clock protein KaiC
LLAKKRLAPLRLLAKAATGIRGFDELSGGGLPFNRTTLLIGGPGTGKTVFALQTISNGARDRKQPGIFVAFEESTNQIFTNAAPFNWHLPAMARQALFFLNARLAPTVVQSGDFELSGMLAILESKKKEIGARWIVFDGIDVLLALLQNPAAEMREIYRLRDWLTENGLTAIITTKTNGDSSGVVNYGFMQFMVDCVIRLDRRLEEGVPVRRLEITKYRGSNFAAGEFPLSFGSRGMEVAAPQATDIRHEVPTERVSSGFPDLNSMLGGGLFRGSSTLITGAPGTSKTTLAGQFAESACRRGERTLLVSFDEGADRIARNLTSVGIHLGPHMKSGLLLAYSGRTDATNPEEHLIRIIALLRKHRPRCMVIDPLSAIAKIGALSSARAVSSRLIHTVRDLHITTYITALVDGPDPQAEATELQISTIADTWIHLSYVVNGGERNRALTIVKSRGTEHSNQVRELNLSTEGLALTDVYSSGGGALMGTLRWEKEEEEKMRKLRQHAEFAHKRRELQFAEADIAARISALQLDLERQRAELALFASDDDARQQSSEERHAQLRRRRGADAVIKGLSPRGKGQSTQGKRSATNGHQAPR